MWLPAEPPVSRRWHANTSALPISMSQVQKQQAQQAAQQAAEQAAEQAKQAKQAKQEAEAKETKEAEAAEAAEAEKEPKEEKVKDELRAEQQKLFGQLKERRLDMSRGLETIAPSLCLLFDSSSQKESADPSSKTVSGSVTCPASASRPTLGNVANVELFKEVDRGSAGPDHDVFLQSGPRPTNAWWSNTFINKNLGSPSNFLTQMPYIIGSDKKGVHVMQPFMTSPGMEEFQHGLGVFLGAESDLTGPYADAWDEACVTLTYRGPSPGQAMTFPSCRGSAYVTAELRGLKPFISSDLPLAVPHEIRVDGKAIACGNYNFVQGKEIEFTLSTGDSWIAFFPPGMGWTCEKQPFRLAAAEIAPARGVVVRLAMLKGKTPVDASWGDLLRQHAGSYPVASGADYVAHINSESAQVIFDWGKHRRNIPGYPECDVLQLVWPNHVSLLSEEEKNRVNSGPKTPFKDLRGESKVFIASAPLVLHYELYPIATEEFAGRNPIPMDGLLREMMLEALKGGEHVAGAKYDGAKTDSEFQLPENVKLAVGDTYFSGKLLARLARLVAIAHELDQSNEAFFEEMLSQLADSMEKWLEKGAKTPFIYDKSWGGLVSCGCNYDDCWGSCAPKCTNDVSQPASCPALHQAGQNFGNGFYNDHHFHYGYFIYSAAVLAKFRPDWERHWRPQILTLIRDYANPSTADGKFPLARHKDWFMGFSWAGGIKFEPLGRNQESVSEAINSYYAIACYGTVLANRGDQNMDLGCQLRQLGRLLTAMEVHSGDMFWHVRPDAEVMSSYGRPTVGIMWEHVALHQTWFGGSGWAVEGIQMLPVVPVLEDFLKKEWVQNHFLEYKVSCDSDPSCSKLGWSWLVCIQQAVLSVKDAFECLHRLDDSAFSLRSPAASGNSLTNSLYWFATRSDLAPRDLKAWPKATQVITTPSPGKSASVQHLGPIRRFGRHGVRMNNRCLKLSDVACPNVPSIRCIGDSCCPDGSLCPSAPYYSNPICKSPKKIACRGTDGHNPAIKRAQKKDGPCPVGSAVFCPGTMLLCQNAQCCPDGSLCPSAPATGRCLKDKVHDCTGGLGQTPEKSPSDDFVLGECQVGAHVKCPNSNLKCWGQMCCADGRPCPSASKTTKCWKEKEVDCLPKEAEAAPAEAFEEPPEPQDRSPDEEPIPRPSRPSRPIPRPSMEAEEDQADHVRPTTGQAECDESRKCVMGASVLCPDKKSRCAGMGCCPDGSLCPSAPALVAGTAGCPSPKGYDCTCVAKAVIVGHASCLVGASVRCPGSQQNCSMNGCCPDGSTCPSAPLGTVCPSPKKEDCTGQTIIREYEGFARAASAEMRHFHPALVALAATLLVAVAAVAKGRQRRNSMYLTVACSEGEA